jgi:hypothetical protein
LYFPSSFNINSNKFNQKNSKSGYKITKRAIIESSIHQQSGKCAIEYERFQKGIKFIDLKYGLANKFFKKKIRELSEKSKI